MFLNWFVFNVNLQLQKVSNGDREGHSLQNAAGPGLLDQGTDGSKIIILLRDFFFVVRLNSPIYSIVG